jgi:hypothetical protein
MSAHHAPRSVVRWCRILANTLILTGTVLACWFIFGLFAAQASTTAREATSTWALWGESSFSAYSAPVGQLVAGIGLVIFGALMSKVGPRIRRSDHQIPMVAAPWKTGDIRRKVAAVQVSTAYPERRIGRRMIGFGIPAVLLGLLMVWLYPAVTEEIVDEGARIAFGASMALMLGAVGLLAAAAAVISGIVYVVRGPSEAASMDAALAERAEAAGAVPPPPPMPGLPVPPPMPSPGVGVPPPL